MKKVVEWHTETVLLSSLILLPSDYDSSDSFCLVPSNQQPGSAVSKLKKENVALKERLHLIESQMESLQKQITQRREQDQQLRDHIILARKEVS